MIIPTAAETLVCDAPCLVLPAAHSLSDTVRSMGTFHYGDSEIPIHIEERALAHLKVVIATKLRRQEAFTLSWRHPNGDPVGRSTIWLHPAIPLRFTFDEPETPQLNVKWIEALMQSANSSGGITLIEEVVDLPKDARPSRI